MRNESQKYLGNRRITDLFMRAFYRVHLDWLLSRLEFRLYHDTTEAMRIIEPIFILGAPRSGTTVFERVFSNHSDLAFFDYGTRVFPRSRILGNRLLQSLFNFDRNYLQYWAQKESNAMVRAGRYKHLRNVPDEGNFVWSLVLPRDMHDYYDVEDVENVRMELLETIIKRQMLYCKKQRFYNKNPSHSVRLRLLYRIFPDAKYIHMYRDGRAVAYSLLQARRRAGGPSLIFGAKPKSTQGLSDEPYILSAGRQWSRIVKHIQEDSDPFDQQVLHISYEEFVEDPIEVCRRSWEFCGLPNDAGSEKNLVEYSDALDLKCMNYKYEEALDAREVAQLTQIVASELQSLGYDV